MAMERSGAGGKLRERFEGMNPRLEEAWGGELLPRPALKPTAAVLADHENLKQVDHENGIYNE